MQSRSKPSRPHSCSERSAGCHTHTYPAATGTAQAECYMRQQHTLCTAQHTAALHGFNIAHTPLQHLPLLLLPGA
jgi:hypothetical protein